MSRDPETLTLMESNKLLDVLLVPTGTRAQKNRGIRNYTMACLMLDAGLRVGEVVSLYIMDLWFQNGPVKSIIITPENSKNGEQRIIPTSTRLQRAIKTLWQHCWLGNHVEDDVPAFWTRSTDSRITTRQIERIISAASKKAIGRSINPHVLRHTFATNLMRITNMRTVQQLLGHKSITSTQIYTHPSQDDLKEAIDKMVESTL